MTNIEKNNKIKELNELREYLIKLKEKKEIKGIDSIINEVKRLEEKSIRK